MGKPNPMMMRSALNRIGAHSNSAAMIGDRHLVGVGESEHGGDEFHVLTYRLAERLASEHPVVLALEVDQAQALRFDRYVRGLDSQSDVDATFVDRWWGDEMNFDQALRDLLVRSSQYHKPIYITENGFVSTDHDDQTEYMVRHLQAVHQAIQMGADVRGYFWWSLVDNFEWSEGYTPRFGLYHTNFETQERTLKKAGEVYAQIVRDNGISDELIKTYGR